MRRCGVGLVVLLVVAWFVWLTTQRPYVHMVAVEPRVCDGESFAEPRSREEFRTLAELRVPVLLRNASVVQAHNWPAMRWNLSHIASRLPVVPVYEQAHPHNTFITFHDNKPLEPVLRDAQWHDFNVKRNASTAALFKDDTMACVPYARQPWLRHACAVPTRERWLYFSARTQLLREFWPEMDTEAPLGPLAIADTGEQANLWLGNAGIVTHTHYDASWNFFVQIKGCKRFTLFPPNTSLPLYPCLHPHIGHLAVDILNDADLSQHEGLNVFVADVVPGDVLVVPPMWFHHVTTLSDSISFNVWTDAPEYVDIHAIYQQPVPLEATWSRAQLLHSALLFLHAVCMRAQGRSCGEAVYTQRYHHLLASNSLKLAPQQDIERIRGLCNSQELNQAVDTERLLERGEAIGREIGSMHVDARTLMLHNYMEHVLLAVSSPETVAHVVQHCRGKY
ncbi:hypothetical protein PTSG_05244 [Salpingoeca rosetta]|uniref:JmjC domain-containing protein n=1 Tax=Salpingoeca rosetta (strain ATCC 50818 / BSB-021) TaxID=946362 RepID=F2UAX2_SALR5|nr:uncharacterized protein PTSG_05244 [Salpingoeca rosetta]EGD73538.1 hypothetical protein PTSG_05244 [Salpingoeca rosetta]|eukprot:XP_004993820.1 hypothetical protein PTSG_05244 [Salpingoeca rosetta]